MKSTVHYRILYSAIAVLIITLLAMFVTVPSKSMALGKAQYTAVRFGGSITGLQKTLYQYSSQGWELVAFDGGSLILIFKK